MLSVDAKGVFPIAPTPFLDDGAIDAAGVDRMIDHYVAAGADGCTILGVMGEAPKLDQDEAIGFVAPCARAKTAVHRRRLRAGIRSDARVVARRHGEGSGGRDDRSATVAAHRRSDRDLLRASRRSDRVGHSLRHSRLSVDAQRHHDADRHPRRIITDNASCVTLKHEDWPGLEKISALRRFENEGKLRRVPILTGNGGLFLDFEMERGVDGAMTGYAFPEMLIDVVRVSRERRREEAHDLFDAHLPLVRYEQQQGAGLATRKYVMMRRGILASDAQRKPGASLSPTAKAEVDYLLTRLARRDARAAKPVLSSVG
jgi:4-hydroxy-tetrahydrodipicolinate synthase